MTEEEKKKSIEKIEKWLRKTSSLISEKVYRQESEEEKKAIEWLKTAKFFSARLYAPSILNLIEKQQKEIEELKERLSIRKEQQETILTEKIKTLREEKIELIHNFEEKEKISKKEIKSLLEEIEELNEIKQQICNEELITQDYVEENFISKEKIREVIEELEDNNERIEKKYKNGTHNLLQNYIENIAQIHILQQLLKEEK